MRVVAIVVLMLVLTTPSKSSQSCMTKTEARQHFGWVHIYWQGKYRCWDATPTRQHHLIDKVQQKIDPPKWHEATPEMLPDQEPLQTPWVEPWVDIEPRQLPIVARGVDIVQVAIERGPEPMVTPPGMVMVIISIALTLAIVEVLFGGMIYQRVASKRNTRSAVFWKKTSVWNCAAFSTAWSVPETIGRKFKTRWKWMNQIIRKPGLWSCGADCQSNGGG